MKKQLYLFTMILFFCSAANAQMENYKTDPHLTPDVKKFLTPLNESGGKPLETLSPAEARQALVDAQKAFKVDYSGIEESTKTITTDGFTITLNIVRPTGSIGV